MLAFKIWMDCRDHGPQEVVQNPGLHSATSSCCPFVFIWNYPLYVRWNCPGDRTGGVCVWFLKVFISYWSITDLQSLSESDAQRSDSPMHIHVCVRATRFSCIWLFVTLWTITRQAPLSMGFSRQGYWRGLPFPSLGDLPHPGVELPVSRGLLPWQRPSLPSCRVFNMGAPQTY